MEKISVAITTWERFEMTVNCISAIIDHPRIDEFVILDDCSRDGSYSKLQQFYQDHPKVKVHGQPHNKGMGINKRDAIELCKSDYVAILDSDNKFDHKYFDALPTLLTPYVFMMPDFASPNFDYRAFDGAVVSPWNVKQYLPRPMFEQCLNTCNMVVHRETYLNVYEHNDIIKETDSIWMNYLLLKAGILFYIVPGMRYEHLVHPGSGWLKNAQYNIDRAEETKKLILEL